MFSPMSITFSVNRSTSKDIYFIKRYHLLFLCTGITSVFFLTISLTHIRIVYKTFLTFDTIRCRYFLYSVDYLVFIIAVSTTLHDSNPSHYTKIPVRFFLTGIFCILMPWIKAPPRCALCWNALRRSRSGGSGGRPLHWCGFRHRCAGSAGSPP